MSVVHDFQECLAKSHSVEDWPVWEQIYRKAFPNFIGMHNHRDDGPHQRNGIDRSVILANGQQILIDEKARFRNAITGAVYDDIALEYLSDAQRNSPGWVCKPLMAHYIAYAIMPLGKCYLLPVIQLQLAWSRYNDLWFSRRYPKANAQNKGWNTLSLCIPVDVLFRAIGGCLRIYFNPIEELDH